MARKRSRFAFESTHDTACHHGDVPPDVITVQLLAIANAKHNRELAFLKGTNVLHSKELPTTRRLEGSGGAAKAKEATPILPLGLSLGHQHHHVAWGGNGDHDHDVAVVPNPAADDNDSNSSGEELHAEELPDPQKGAAGAPGPPGDEPIMGPVAAVARLGIVGFDEAVVTSRASCLVCVEKNFAPEISKFAQGAPRFLYAWRKNAPERSIHVACVLSGAVLDLPQTKRAHWAGSEAWLTDAGTLPGVPPERQALFLDAAHVTCLQPRAERRIVQFRRKRKPCRRIVVGRRRSALTV